MVGVTFVERWPDLGDDDGHTNTDNSSRRRQSSRRRWARANQVLRATWAEGIQTSKKRRREQVDDCQEDQDGVLGLRGGLIYKKEGL